ncbi:hypothetical protein N7517_004374 [Penicillium concentricum]|uniref:Nucleotide-diphospho-sugar transferase n=1 Tax=Penicillium concentricum TaxID=293559 RepID=A0A9W9V834_9EURO|nr:uncharacterized protein N7517_004374 [Penicillium concentricum]KAJ5372368.1 hypothetical protein N7517_004374 [Penicillium concentricum]
MLPNLPKAARAIIVIIVLFFIAETLLILSNGRTNTSFYEFHHESPKPTDALDWSRFAYTQYVTNTPYLCNSVMLFETLNRLQSKADRVMMYPSEFSRDESDNGTESRLLRKARDEYKVKLVPIEIQSRSSGDATWAESFTKLLAFNQTQYDRVLSLDSDATMLQHMDELFFMPPFPLAIPRAYWLNPNDRVMSSQLLLIQPSHFEFNRIMTAIATAGRTDYDMEIMNHLYGDSALILPHRPYTMLTGEFRNDDHSKYLGNSNETWNPDKVLKEAKFVHFSDWPVPKPWISPPSYIMDEKKPSCHMNLSSGHLDDCRDRDYWLGLYADFTKRRKDVCGDDI